MVEFAWKDWRKIMNTHKSVLSVLTIDNSGCLRTSGIIYVRCVVSNISVSVYIMCSSYFDIISVRVICLWLKKKETVFWFKFFFNCDLQYALPGYASNESFPSILFGLETSERAFQKYNKFSNYDFSPRVFTLHFHTRATLF